MLILSPLAWKYFRIQGVLIEEVLVSTDRFGGTAANAVFMLILCHSADEEPYICCLDWQVIHAGHDEGAWCHLT